MKRVKGSMAQSGDSGWIRDAIQLAQSSTILQWGGAVAIVVAGTILARGARNKLFGSADNEVDKKERDAYDRMIIEMDILKRTNEALVRYVELKSDGMLDDTHVNKNSTRPIPLDELDMSDNE